MVTTPDISDILVDSDCCDGAILRCARDTCWAWEQPIHQLADSALPTVIAAGQQHAREAHTVTIDGESPSRTATQVTASNER